MLALLVSLTFACNRKPPSLEAHDVIDRRVNVPMTEPISRDLAAIRERGSLVVLAPYNSTTYFIYQENRWATSTNWLKPCQRARRHFEDDCCDGSQKPFAFAQSGDGDLAAARLIPTPENEAVVSFTRGFTTRSRPWCSKLAAVKSRGRCGEALEPGPADQLPETDIEARLITKPSACRQGSEPP